jgi:hypothetical protein
MVWNFYLAIFKKKKYFVDSTVQCTDSFINIIIKNFGWQKIVVLFWAVN